MTGSTHLPTVNIVDAMGAHSTSLSEAATTRYTTSVGRAHSGLDELARLAADRHTKPVDAINAAADLLERFSDSVESNGDAIVASLAHQTSGASQALQLAAAEQRAIAAEQANGELLRGAQRASDLQISLDLAQAETARIQRELDSLRTRADAPNPLQGRVTELEAENTRLQQELEVETAAKNRLQAIIDAARPTATPAPAANVTPPQQPAEPDDADVAAVDPNSAVGDPDDAEPAEPSRRRRLGWLPGHGRNQGGDA